MTVVPVGGSALRSAWGRITKRSVSDRRRPSARAACHCVRSMAAMAARKISAKNAPMLRPSATDAAPKAPRSRPKGQLAHAQRAE